MKEYVVPEWEIISFSSENEVIITCSDDCSGCFFLVCQPQDVIIGR